MLSLFMLSHFIIAHNCVLSDVFYIYHVSRLCLPFLVFSLDLHCLTFLSSNFFHTLAFLTLLSGTLRYAHSFNSFSLRLHLSVSSFLSAVSVACPPFFFSANSFPIFYLFSALLSFASRRFNEWRETKGKRGVCFALFAVFPVVILSPLS